ncbi:hypothetical protein H1R20_g7495, partial [Candolleomyces eurysporus]
MSTTVVTANATPAATGYGRPKRPGWWWKRRRERMRQGRAEEEPVQEIPSGAYIEELPDDATVTEETLAPAIQEDGNAGAKEEAKQQRTQTRTRTRTKRRNNGTKNKKKVKGDATDASITEDIEGEAPASEAIPAGPVQEFFAQYEGFVYRPRVKPNKEFNRLGHMMNWQRGDDERNSAWRQLASAMAFQFEERYGSDVNDLGAWQKLCERIGITPIPNELEEAKEASVFTSRETRSLWMIQQAVLNTHVNLVDLTTLPENEEITIFASERQLSKYTRERSAIFPRSDAVASGTLLHSLLRRITFPPPAGSRRDLNGRIIRPNHRDEDARPLPGSD